MKKTSQSIWQFIFAIIGLVVAVQIAWALAKPFLPVIAVVFLIVVIAIIYKRVQGYYQARENDSLFRGR